MLKQNINAYFIYNLKNVLNKVLILSMLAAFDDCSDSIDKISIKL